MSATTALLCPPLTLAVSPVQAQNNSGLKVGIGAGISVVALGVILGLATYFWTRKDKPTNHTEHDETAVFTRCSDTGFRKEDTIIDMSTSEPGTATDKEPCGSRPELQRAEMDSGTQQHVETHDSADAMQSQPLKPLNELNPVELQSNQGTDKDDSHVVPVSKNEEIVDNPAQETSVQQSLRHHAMVWNKLLKTTKPSQIPQIVLQVDAAPSAGARPTTHADKPGKSSSNTVKKTAEKRRKPKKSPVGRSSRNNEGAGSQSKSSTGRNDQDVKHGPIKEGFGMNTTGTNGFPDSGFLQTGRKGSKGQAKPMSPLPGVHRTPVRSTVSPARQSKGKFAKTALSKLNAIKTLSDRRKSQKPNVPVKPLKGVSNTF